MEDKLLTMGRDKFMEIMGLLYDIQVYGESCSVDMTPVINLVSKYIDLEIDRKKSADLKDKPEEQTTKQEESIIINDKEINSTLKELGQLIPNEKGNVYLINCTINIAGNDENTSTISTETNTEEIEEYTESSDDEDSADDTEGTTITNPTEVAREYIRNNSPVGKRVMEYFNLYKTNHDNPVPRNKFGKIIESNGVQKI
jgi:hypothetical protein